MRITRRQALAATLSTLASFKLARTAPAQQNPRVPRRLFGLQTYSYSIHQRQDAAFGDPLTLLAFTARQGFAGVQLRLGTRPQDYLTQVRTTAVNHRLFVEAIAAPPFEDKDAERFEAELRDARASGVDVVRTALLSGRRYETFRNADDYRQFQARSENALRRMATSAARHRIRIAVENHKDFRAQELADRIRKLNNEFMGVCLDTGNNIALLEDPQRVVETLAPLAFTVHLKDMAVEEAADGFLLAEVPLGSGYLDLPRIVRCIHQANPRARFNLEMITRDPLRIPCLTDDYWRTLAETPAIDLARTLTAVRQHARPKNDLPRIQSANAKEQRRREEANVTQSRDWAATNLFSS